MQLYCSKRLRKIPSRARDLQGAQSLRSEAYFAVGRKDEGCRATSPEGDKQYMNFLRRRSL
jgi:hypothetical protein